MNIKYYLKTYGRKFLMYFYSITKKDKKKSAFFISFSGQQYSDSPRAISEALHEANQNIEIIWLGNEDVKKAAPEYVKVVRAASIDALKKMAQADVWVANTSLSMGTYKNKRVFYVQTFHGDRGFKRCGYDAAATMGNQYGKSSLHFIENKICDVYMVGSRYGRELAEKAFDYHRRITEYGIPRNDRLMNIEKYSKYADTVRQSLEISPDTKILLYAPTFRDNQRDKQDINVDLVSALDILSRKGDKWICLLRAHSATKELYFASKDERIMDVSHYHDMADLLLVSDILITDYSSSAPEFVLTNKPVILAQYDLEDYIKHSRTLAFDPEQSGFLIAKNTNELNELLSNIYDYDHRAIRELVDDFYGTTESGEATKRICKEICEWLDKK